ncbi:MAG TPA: response regulator [Candidatus Dormibacteraeota bacterium]|nr:response regulator [Candidatus Dormibacteraeota bacterium]
MATGIWFPEIGWAPSFGAPAWAARDRGLDPSLGRRIHVLMIEDDPAIAEMYRLQLEHDGYVVSIATTGEIAQSLLAADGPDLVLLDLLLPDRSGFDVLASLNEGLPNHPPVVILSNYGEPSMMDRGRSLGAIEYLVKSRVTPAEISRQIPTWIEESHGGEPADS